jgi:hypothetical protein
LVVKLFFWARLPGVISVPREPSLVLGLVPLGASGYRRGVGFRVVSVVCLLAVGGCLFDAPQRVVPGEDLLAVADAGAVDAQQDTGDVGGDGGDSGSGQDVADATEVAPLFECEPPCDEGLFCGPSGVCYRGAPTCTATNQTCDPALVRSDEQFVCESVYDARVGYCRRRCADSDDCPSGEVCSPVRLGSDALICRRGCEGSEDCLPLDTCTGDGGQCRAGCVSFYGGQCDAGTGCRPATASDGYCDAVGGVPVGVECNPGLGLSCVEDAVCQGNPVGDRCARACAPAQDDPAARGGCEGDRETCTQFGSETAVGICAITCDLFDEEFRCEHAEKGCLADGETSGVCVYKGRLVEGQACSSTEECMGQLACVGEGSLCRNQCLSAAAPGERGACSRDISCVPLGGGLGYCLP